MVYTKAFTQFLGWDILFHMQENNLQFFLLRPHPMAYTERRSDINHLFCKKLLMLWPVYKLSHAPSKVNKFFLKKLCHLAYSFRNINTLRLKS